LNETIEEAYEKSEEVKQALTAWEAWKKNKKIPRPTLHYEDVARDWMCDNFFDVRCFGAVMSTGEVGGAEGESRIRKTAGQVRGPVQLTFARSVSPVVPLEHAITRMAVTNVADLEKERTIGRKNTIPYGLYRAHGFVSPKLAEQTGFSEEDLALLWDALWNMFDHDRSAARGMMSTRALIRFRHESALGNAPANELFERISVQRQDGASVPRSFGDFRVDVRREGLPAGVSIVDGRP
jgi:CRISPR-associated protein Csd2